MKFVFTSLLLLILLNKSVATIISVSGQVNGTWSADTVLVEGNLTIPAGELLLVYPGTVVQFQSYYRIDVLGGIWAQGVEGDSIVFTIRDTSNFNAQSQGRGGWSGIRFCQLPANNDSSVFSFCRFEFSKATEDSANSYGGAISANGFDKLRFSNCTFFHNYSFFSGGAVYLRDADARIENCIFNRNTAGNTGTVYGYGGGICAINSSPLINQNEFYGNSSTGVGGAVSFDNSDPVFENNNMQYNFSALGGALGVLRSSPVKPFANNLVANNNALFFGGGICCIRSFPVFSNLTIAGNSAAYAGGFYCNDSAAPATYNSVIWGNSGFGPSVYIWDIYSAPAFYYCDIEGDSTGFEGSGAHQGYHGQYHDNLNQDPAFLTGDTDPFQLSPSSPCIDAGTPDAGFLNLPPADLSGNPRIENNRIDLGAYEYRGITSNEKYKQGSGYMTLYPNPFRQSVTIELPAPMVQTTTIVIEDIQGRLVKRMYILADDLSVSWDGCDEQGNTIAKGLYVVKAISRDKIYTGKILK